MEFSNRKKVIALMMMIIITIVIEYRIGNFTLVKQAKIWNKRASTLIPPVNITVVTAFFDIGSAHRHGRPIRYQTVYFKWAELYQYMKNALVVYTDSESFRKHITAVRSNLSSITEIVLVNRSALWSFQNLPKISEIYKLKRFPKNSSALYTCATHAKFELLSYTAKNKNFNTNFFMWIDIGYFRHRKSRGMFYLSQPKQFNDSKIAINQIADFKKSINPTTLIENSISLVGGGLFFGKRVCVISFEEDFKRAVRYFLSKGITNTEEQILGALYSANGKRILKPTVDIQLYRNKSDKVDHWFYLGYSMITEENFTRF